MYSEKALVYTGGMPRIESIPPSAFSAMNGQIPSWGDRSRPVWHPSRRVAHVSQLLGSKGGCIPTMARHRALPARTRTSSSQVGMGYHAFPSRPR